MATAYCPLQDNEIRVLHLSRQDEGDNLDPGGGKGHMPFRLSLERASLTDRPLPSYTALSYAWGCEEATVPLMVSNMQLCVTQNLYTILETLSSRDASQYLWVDAICINQNDVAERAIQVRLMGSVYSRASLVLVFLSPVSAPFDIGISFLERAATHANEHYEPALSPHIAIDGLNLHSEALRDSLIGFFGTAWWTRVWTVQEFALARNVLFQCGQRRIDRTTLGRAFECLRDHERNCCWASLRVADGYPRGYLDIPSPANGGLSIFRSILRYDQIHTMIAPDDTEGYDFVELMKAFRPRLCSDPRDRIYGMLGLKLKDKKIRDLVHTNNYPSAASLFKDIAMIIIEQSGTLDLLSHVLPSSVAEPTVQGLPSWVPDWNARLDVSSHLAYSDRTTRLSLYHVPGNPKPTWALTSTGRVATEAHFIGNIVADAPGYPKRNSILTGKPLLDMWVKTASMGTEVEQNHKIQEGGDTVWEREREFSILISGNLELKRWSDDPSESAHQKAYQMWVTWFASENPSSLSASVRSDVREFDEFVQVNTLGRRLFRTDTGWIGFGPESLHISDSLAMIPGSKVPYILRQLPTGNGKAYAFLGDAYAQEAISCTPMNLPSLGGVPKLTKIELI
ncbi:putative heterokaryon incompatibility protein [Rosellinia necatrix]|uniref:Putative heterokaryon incompatibility protein n=1 Tax=Rosellinia necatrix TaxID=77044 RepID=A0A1W2TGF1_ROSNE|nr:putative heterokaryon incompatibility protein [Rosellinia necatrix]